MRFRRDMAFSIYPAPANLTPGLSALPAWLPVPQEPADKP
ncbi:hypothetical protein A628_01019 [Salmonella enterica subsp. enterica serovar Cubana str. 76814]|uniref:Uncharacterized protein n=1 Tax=Salmonella enterica subsp. enterica serovar Cubana str. 76814 TaxID=1192560 RepID=V7IVL5_SALET|nr:hypothetical protein A628_01019 [Salmonella enterica subsp. enterica serovar Cubana str. 76814]